MRRRLLWGLLALLAAGVLLTLWLVTSTAGSRSVLEAVAARVPGLKIGKVEGNLYGGLTFGGLAWNDPLNQARIERAGVEVSLWSLLRGAPHLRRLSVDGLELTYTTAPAVAGAPGLQLPAVEIDTLELTNLRLRIDGVEHRIERASGALRMDGSALEITQLDLVAAAGSLRGALTLDFAKAQALRVAQLDLGWGTAPATAWRGSLRATPSGAQTRIDATLVEPLRATLGGMLGDDLRRLDLRLVVPEQDGAPLGIDGPLSAELDLSGADPEWRVSGTLAALGESLRIEEGLLRMDEGRLDVRQIGLQVGTRGKVQLDGAVPLDAVQDWALRATSTGLLLPRGGGAPLRVLGTLVVDGPRNTPRVQADLQLESTGLPPATLTGAARWLDGAIALDGLLLDVGRGRAMLDGRLSFDAPATLNVVIAALDPSLFASDWPGAVDADLRWDGALAPQGAAGTLHLSALGGTLRGRPLAGNAMIVVDGGTWRSGTLAVESGGARLRAEALDGGQRIDATLVAADLADLAPGLAGSMDLAFKRDAGDSISARAQQLRYGNWQAQAVQLEATLSTGADPLLTAQLDAGDASFGGRALGSVALRAEGRRSAHVLTLSARGAEQSLDARFDGGWKADGWHGILQVFDAQAAGLALRLREPTVIDAGSGRIEVARSCLALGTGAACIAARYTAGVGTLDAELDAMSLDALRTLLPATTVPDLEGRIDGRVRVSWDTSGPRDGELDLRSPSGVVRLPERPDLDLGYRNLVVRGQWQDGNGTLAGGADLTPDGRIDVAAELSRDAAGVFGYDATLDVLVTQLDGIEAFTTQIAEPEGEIRGHLRITGGNVERRFSGAVALSGFTAQVPAYALRLREGVLVLAGVPGKLVVRGSVLSGDGTLTIDGRIDTADPVPALLHISGKDVRVSNTPTLSVLATPDLVLSLRDKRWNLDGTLDIPRARIDASKLEGGADRSPDVVVVDAETPPDPPRPWRARVAVTLGDDVKLEGFGFDGSLAGKLEISQRQGAQALANGEITVKGRYNAYGQRLTIQRGGLRYANSPLAEPTLDLRAERKVREQTVALVVTGSATRPESRIVGSNGMTDTEALSLLVTGRPLNRADAGDRDQLSDAAVALGTVGSDLLTGKLRGRLGLDEFGVSNDTALDAEAFTLGKYLSPRLYVGYGIGLLTRGEVFTVRYLLTEHIELEANTGATQRAAINYRIEK